MSREVHIIEHEIERGDEQIEISVYYTIAPGHPMFFDRVYGNWMPPESPEIEFTGRIDGIPCDMDLTEQELADIIDRIMVEEPHNDRITARI